MMQPMTTYFSVQMPMRFRRRISADVEYSTSNSIPFLDDSDPVHGLDWPGSATLDGTDPVWLASSDNFCAASVESQFTSRVRKRKAVKLVLIRRSNHQYPPTSRSGKFAQLDPNPRNTNRPTTGIPHSHCSSAIF